MRRLVAFVLGVFTLAGCATPEPVIDPLAPRPSMTAITAEERDYLAHRDRIEAAQRADDEWQNLRRDLANAALAEQAEQRAALER